MSADVLQEKGTAVSATNKAKDKAQAAKGKVKKSTGQAVGNPVLEGKGKAEQAKGNLKEAGEKVKDAGKKRAGDVTDGEAHPWIGPALGYVGLLMVFTGRRTRRPVLLLGAGYGVLCQDMRMACRKT